MFPQNVLKRSTDTAFLLKQHKVASVLSSVKVKERLPPPQVWSSADRKSSKNLAGKKKSNQHPPKGALSYDEMSLKCIFPWHYATNFNKLLYVPTDNKKCVTVQNPAAQERRKIKLGSDIQLVCGQTTEQGIQW